MSALYIWENSPALSIIVLVALSMVFLYFARQPIHLALQGLADGTAGGLHKIAEWANNLSNKMDEKHRKVLLESGIADTERKVTEEFRKAEAGYLKHLSNYPTLHRKLDDNISRIDSDYKECGQATPEAPGWSGVIESIARVKGSSGDRVIEKMLSEIHKSAIEGEKRALSELRNTTSKRHKVLAGLAPAWKRVAGLMQDVNKKVSLVLETTSKIDKHMSQYEKIRKGDNDSIDMLSSRATKLFIFSLIVITIAGFGAFINFQLIALPMSELVPQGTRVIGLPVSDIAALVIVTLEIVLGIFMMEALGITNIFPQIAGMLSGKRRILLYVSITGLFLLASVEAALAILREHIAEADISVMRQLAGETASMADAGKTQIATLGQAALGFILPWILALVAVPLEMFIESAQHVINRLLSLIIVLLGYVSKIISYIIEYMMKVIMHLYDAYIIIPARISLLVSSKNTKSK